MYARLKELAVLIIKFEENPQKILGPYIEEGMTVLDLGCGPGGTDWFQLSPSEALPNLLVKNIDMLKGMAHDDKEGYKFIRKDNA